MEIQTLAKMLVVMGLVIALIGVMLYIGAHFSLPFGRLPGDVRVERPGFRFYFPITTSIILSIVLSLVLFIISRFR